MKPSLALSTLLLAFVSLTGCASQSQFLASKQQLAKNTALNRGRFEMNCPTATASILSSEVIQPAVEGPRMMGVQRAEYTVGVEGCGQRSTYVVVCPDMGEGCFAGEGRR
jgi:hypothetical protein